MTFHKPPSPMLARYPDYSDGELAVVLCHFNPCGFHAPVANLWRTLAWLESERLPTFAYDLRCGVLEGGSPALPAEHPHVQSAISDSVIFYKENLWNAVARRLPAQYEFILCLDADVIIEGDRLRERLVSALRTTPVVQPFAHAHWTDSLGRSYKDKPSMGYAFVHGLANPHVAKLFHPGFALAFRRDFWSKGPGFYEREPLGGGNTMFVAAVTGSAPKLVDELAAVSIPLASDYASYAAAAAEWTQSNVGYIEGTAVHLWHGSTKKRQYLERTSLLRGFDPLQDLCASGRDGVLRWTSSALEEKSAMISAIRNYFASREEDEWFDSAAG